MPRTSAAEVRDKLSEPLPELPARIDDVLATVRDIVYPLSRHNGHPRFFGYVASPGSPVTVAAPERDALLLLPLLSAYAHRDTITDSHARGTLPGSALKVG